MSPPRRNRSSGTRRRTAPGRDEARDLWRAVPAPPEPESIVPASDPTALLASLGPPPLHAHSTVAEHYFAAVAERAAALATALAASAGLLAQPDGD